MITIIAEKPSVARQISRVVGAMERKVGYYGGNNYCVTWAFGHLIQLAMPEAYGVTCPSSPMYSNSSAARMPRVKRMTG